MTDFEAVYTCVCPLRVLGGCYTNAVVSGFFVSCYCYSNTMRYVGGCVLNNPVTRANQSRDGGLRIDPGGRPQGCKSVPLKRWHGSINQKAISVSLR